MAQISQNKLTPLLVLIAAVVVGVILYKQGQSDAVPAGAPMSQVPEAGLPATERGADADTPNETLRTVVGETRALSSEVRALREENQRLRSASGPAAMDNLRAQLRNELRGEMRAELNARQGAQPSAPPAADAGPLGQVLGGAPRELVGALPHGFGFEQSTPGASVASTPAALPMDTGRRLLPAGYRLGKGADGKQGIVRDTPLAAPGVLPAPPVAAQPIAPKTVEVKPFYTIPENATLLGATAMTALIGRVPVNGQVTDPMQFKLLLGPENLAANGHVLPANLAGVVVSGVAIGDMALSCSEGLIQSLTFVFNDGAIHTVSRRSNGTTPTFGGGSGGGAGGKSALAEAPKLGYISDRYGNPCIPGQFVTNAPSYLTDIVGLRTLSLAGKAAAASQTTQSTNAFGGVNSSVTGNRGTFILGEAVSGGVDEVSSWIMSRLNNSFDAVVVAAGAEVAVHIDTEIPIDKSSQARRLDYGRIDAGRTRSASTRGHWYGMD
ncbi:MAG: TIGR03752 family integrating conjugative element protein [Rhodocyclaceae bacterium]|nr:TIGR03752 family integrating conjugative element protein [Rhodocyclaceae bacterium]